MTAGPVTADQVRHRLGGAPLALEEDLETAVAVAVAHIVPILDPAYRDPATWDDDLNDGVALAAVLTWRNMESPLASPSEAYAEGGRPATPR